VQTPLAQRMQGGSSLGAREGLVLDAAFAAESEPRKQMTITALFRPSPRAKKRVHKERMCHLLSACLETLPPVG